MENVALILLAAGQSKRLGKPKQLLKWKGKTLLEHLIGAGAKSRCSSLTVVISPKLDLHAIRQDEMPVRVVTNPNPEAGMGNSIALGVGNVMELKPPPDAIMIMLVDQPLVTTHAINNIIDAWKIAGQPIIASSYEDNFGPPALFEKKYFPELLLLKGDQGAKSIMLRNKEYLHLIPFVGGLVDVDTPEDWESFLKNFS